MAYQKIFINRQPRLQADIEAGQNMVSGIGKGLDMLYGMSRDARADAARDEEMRLRKEDRERLYTQAKTKALLDLQDIKDPEQRAAYAPFIFKAYGIPYTSEDVYGQPPQMMPTAAPGQPPVQGAGAMPDQIEYGPRTGNFGAPGQEQNAGLEMADLEMQRDPRASMLFPAAQERINREEVAATALGAPPAPPRGPLLGQRIVADLGGQKVTMLDPQRDLELREAARARTAQELASLGLSEDEMQMWMIASTSGNPEIRKQAGEFLKAKRDEAKELAKATAAEETWKRHFKLTSAQRLREAAILAGRKPPDANQTKLALLGQSMEEDLAQIEGLPPLSAATLAKVQSNELAASAATKTAEGGLLGATFVEGLRGLEAVPRSKYEGLTPQEQVVANAYDNVTESYIRILTGAGMPEDEARKAAVRDAPHAGDSSQLVQRKIGRMRANAARLMRLSGNAAGLAAPPGGVHPAQQPVKSADDFIKRVKGQ